MSSLVGDIYEESLARVILWNFVFVLAKLKDLCVLDITYDHDDIYIWDESSRA